MFPKITMTKVLGNVPLLYRFCLKQGLSEIIDEIVPDRTQTSSPCSTGELVSLLVVNRLIDPQPLYKVDDWMKRNGIASYFPCDASFINDDRIGRELDFLYPYWEQIKQKFVRHMVKKHHIDPRLIHYDITSLYFEGKYDNEEMITYGYSRDQKPDKKQINLAVNMTDNDPFPLRWQVLPGNTADTSTMIANMEALKELFQEQKFVLIGDRAMISEEIYKEVMNYKYDLIVPLKDSKTTKKLLQEVEVSDLQQEIVDQKTKEVKFRLGEFTVPYNEDPELPPLRAIVVWSKSKARTNRQNRERKIQKRRQELSELKRKLNQPYYRKYSSIEKKISKIMGKDPINEGFSVVLTEENGTLSLEVHEHETVWEALARRDGFYVLATTLSRIEFTTLDIFNLYKRQHLVENGFKILKKEMTIRPIFVHQKERIIGLVNITLLALCIYSILKILLKRHSLDISVKRLLEVLPLLVIIQFLLPDKSLHFQLSPIPADQSIYLQVLGVEDIESWLAQQLELHFNFANPRDPGLREKMHK